MSAPHISTEALERMARDGNPVAALALEQRRALTSRHNSDENTVVAKAEATVRNMSLEIQRLKRRIAELESGRA